MFCKNCWANIPDGSTECPKCMKHPGRTPEPPKVEPKPPPRLRASPDFQGDLPSHSGPFGYSPLQTTVLILFIGISGWLLYTHRPSTRTAAAPEPVATAAPVVASVKPRGVGETIEVSTVVKGRSSEEGVPGGLGEIEMMEPARDAAAAYKAFEDGSYLKASILFKAAIDERPYDRSLKDALAATLVSRGRVKLDAGEYSAARNFIKEALTYEDRQEYYRPLAAAYVGLGDSESAIKVFEKVRGGEEADKSLVSLYTTLGNKSYQSGDYDKALKFFKEGLLVDPSNEYFKTRLTNIKARVPASEIGYREKDDAHFIVRYEGGTDSVAGHLVSILLEEAYIKVGADLGYYPTDKIGAVLHSKKKFHDVTRSPKWVGALYDGRIKIPSGELTRRTRTLEKVIFHEYTHALVHRIAKGRAPTWLNEGLAQIEESKRGRDYDGVLKAVAKRGKFSLKSLERSFSALQGDDVTVAYAVSLSATEYIVRSYGLFTVVRILKMIGEGHTVEKAIFTSTYLSYEEFNKRWFQSIKKLHR